MLDQTIISTIFLKKRLWGVFKILLIGFCCLGFQHLKAQIYSKNKDVVKMLCFLDGEIIFDPDTSITVQALSKIDIKNLGITRIIGPGEATRIYGKRGKHGVFLMYSKHEPLAESKNQQILFKYNSSFSEDKFYKYFKNFNKDSVINCSHPRPGDLFPEFPGGNQALSLYMNTNLHYPDIAEKNQIMGKVILGFIVHEDGAISDLTVVLGRDLPGGLPEEALRVGENMPRFYPGSRNHIPMKAYFTLPIRFTIDPRKVVEEAN